uniref:Lin54 protein n=1 Tax=Fopius arisanus TaxID=64838 RepID=A0A0C9PP89_9HYME
MSSNKSTGPRALVEPLTLADNELSALNISNSDHYSTSELESFVSIEADLECMNEEVMTTEEIILERPEDNVTIAPDVEMTDLSEEVQSEQIIYTTANQTNQNVVFQTKPTLQRVPMSAVQVKPNVVQPTQSQSIMIVSPAGGSGTSQILKISHPATASRGQIQSLAQSIITAKSADGNIVHLRSAQTGKPLVATSQGANITVSNIQGAKAVQSVKRPPQVVQNRNVITKMILSGSQTQPGQEVILTSTQDSPQSQTIKFLTTTNAPGLNSPAKTITFAQAQQMGLISGTNKVQQILPSTTQKQQGILLNKSGLVVQTSTSQPPKLTLIPTSSVKSPAKILPAPTITTQVRQTTIPNSQVAFTNTGKTTVQPSSQKVIIRQSALKPGTVLGGGQVIRIPGHPIQMPGRQVQYVRLVSTASSPTTNVVTVGKPKTQTIQAMGVTQKIGGQQQLVKVVPLNTAANQPLRTVAPKATISGGSQRLLIPAPTPAGTQAKNTVAIPASALSQLASGQAVISTNSNVGNIVVLPAQYIQQPQTEEVKPKPSPSTPSLLSGSQSTSGNLSTSSSVDPPTPKGSQKTAANTEANGIRPRKPCNCTKSQCLKLYCDCFANGEFCHMCNCNNCSNNLGNEEERQRAIKTCLERNPNAFRPKIGKGRETGDDIRRHNKGCNCKRSGCLKNYCECYEAKIPCSANCKCIGCRNVEEPAIEKKSLKDLADAAEVRTTQQMMNNSKVPQFSAMTFRPPATSNTGPRQPFNFLTEKVVEMTCQCLMAQAEDAERSMLDEDTSQRLIIEEFGRCLKEIIESAYEAEATT